MTDIYQQLIEHEGLRLTPYRDTVGKLTIGVGRNLDDVGISKDEALAMLAHDVERVNRELSVAFPWYPALDAVRGRVLIDMGFNMGVAKLKGFTRTLASVARGDYVVASVQMLESQWAQQVGNRAVRLAAMMKTGEV